MGQLEVSCFAQGSNNVLYALSFGYDLSVKSGNNSVAILLQSNASPSGPNTLTWQAVSTIRQSELFSFLDNLNLQCSVDPNGSFLAWSYNAYTLGAAAGASPRPGGFRYDPTLSTSSATTTGKGGWANVDTPLNYTWTSSSAGGDLFYLSNGNNYNFYHAYIPGAVGASFDIGVLNKTVTPNLMVNSATKWSVLSTIAGVNGMKTSATKMFVWGSAGNSSSLFGSANLPSSGPLPTSAPSLQLDNYTTPVTGCLGPQAFNDQFYKYCVVNQQHGQADQLYVWDGSEALSPIGMSQLPLKDQYTSAVTGVFGDSSTTYMLVQSGKLSTQDGSAGSYMLMALALSGSAAGSVLNVPNNITVSENLTFYATQGEAGGGGGGSGPYD
ncbi:hypothetical protein BGZ58_009773 [Dissophora ornata]|nr:hypothetical protein BGZ58_009773 [Dissophora ornata]